MLLAALLIPTPVKTWEDVIAALSKRPTEARQAMISIGAGNMYRWLESAGVRARFDRRQVPGVYLDSLNKPIKVAGVDLGIIVGLDSVSTAWQRYESGNSRMVFLFMDGVRLRHKMLDVYGEFDYYLFPEKALVQGRILYTLGYSDYGNAPRWSIRTYPLSSPQMGEVTSVETEDEVAGAGAFRWINGRLSIDLNTRCYPTNLSASHATSCRSHTERWELRGAFWKRKWRKLRNTPYNRLDELYGRLRSGGSVRSFAADDRIARQIAGLRSRLGSGSSEVQFPNSACDVDTEVLAIGGLKVAFHFVRKDGNWVVGKITAIDPTIFY